MTEIAKEMDALDSQLLRISFGSQSSGDFEVSVATPRDQNTMKNVGNEIHPSAILPSSSCGSKKKRKKSSLSHAVPNFPSDAALFKMATDSGQDLFRRWTDEEKKDLMWKLFLSLESGESKVQILTKMEQMMKRDPFSFLPSEISVYILSFLERRDLARAAQVCTSWKNLAYDHTLLIEKIKVGSIYCLSCNSFVGQESDIVSRKFRLDYSLAFTMKTLCNVELGPEEQVEYANGTFKIAKTSCKNCKSKLGVKYLDALTPGNEDKKNTFLIKKKSLFFPGEPAHHIVLVCKGCKTTVAKDQDIIDWNYVLRGGEAYLFSRLFNICLGTPARVTYTTGNYTVADAFCSNCEANLGVKYIEAPSARNAYKVGAYLVEKPKLQVVSHSSRVARTVAEAQTERKGKQKGLFGSILALLKK